jgi:hypothetical protein
MCGGSGGIAPHIINLTSRWNEKSASCPGCFNHCERASDTDWIGGWVGPRTLLDLMEKIKKFLSLPEFEPRFLGRPTCTPFVCRPSYHGYRRRVSISSCSLAAEWVTVGSSSQRTPGMKPAEMKVIRSFTMSRDPAPESDSLSAVTRSREPLWWDTPTQVGSGGKGSGNPGRGLPRLLKANAGRMPSNRPTPFSLNL